MTERYPRIASFKGVSAIRQHLAAMGADLPLDETILAAPESPLAKPLGLGTLRTADVTSPNRFVIHPMEGWDATGDGYPSELTTRRWQGFGRSGAGLIWGGEAAAVCPDGRANPNQLMILDATANAIGKLRDELFQAAQDAERAKPIVGLQLTHSGRWARSENSGTIAPQSAAKGVPTPRIAMRHPLLDRRVGIGDDTAILDDFEIATLIERFARAAFLAQEEGFDFVDLKSCHGYLLHEFLAARDRDGLFGGEALADRARLLLTLVDAVSQAAPHIGIGVRLSVFDRLPHRPNGTDSAGRLGPGIAEDADLPYRHGFGVDPSDPTQTDLHEPIELVRQLLERNVRLINVTAGSPYYVPHIQRPALFPPSDGYAPPEDPLLGVTRLLAAARDIKQAAPDAVVISTGWTYLQEFIPHAAQACVRQGWFDAIGLGRMALSYPEFPADVLTHATIERKRICRTFSDCTTAPRNGMVSGCYPLDPFYRARPERAQLELRKQSR